MDTTWVSLLGADIRPAGDRYRGRCLVAGDGPPLLLLHGQGGHLENFSRNVATLARTHTVYAPDCVWHGLGPQPPFDPELLPTYVDQVVDLVAAEGLGRVAVLGQSMGGWTALRLALDRPDLVDALVLVNPQGIHLPADGDQPEIAPAPGPAVRAKHLPALTEPSERTVRARVAGLVADPARIDDEVVAIRLALYRRPRTNASLRAVIDAYMAGPGSPVQEHRVTPAQLGTIDRPVQLIWGEQNMVPPAGGRRMAALIPGAAFHEIPDAGHWAHFEAPAEHDAVVAAFLTGARTAAARG